MSKPASRSPLLLLLVITLIAKAGGAEDAALVRYSDAAREAFKEVDPDASYVFVSGRDSSGFPASFTSEDGVRMDASALWPTIVRIIKRAACKEAGPITNNHPPALGRPSNDQPPLLPLPAYPTTTTYDQTTFILAVLAALGTGWALGLASKKAADCLKVAGATAGGGVVAGCAAAWTIIITTCARRHREQADVEMGPGGEGGEQPQPPSQPPAAAPAAPQPSADLLDL